jgi:hypothetical protein
MGSEFRIIGSEPFLFGGFKEQRPGQEMDLEIGDFLRTVDQDCNLVRSFQRLNNYLLA